MASAPPPPPYSVENPVQGVPPPQPGYAAPYPPQQPGYPPQPGYPQPGLFLVFNRVFMKYTY